MTDLNTIYDWPTDPDAIDNIAGIPLAENEMYPRHVNNAFRTMMAQLRLGLGANAFDPAAYGADNTATDLANDGWQDAIDAATAEAGRNGGQFSLKATPGKYAVEWDGISGVPYGGAARTAINQRCIFPVSDASVKKVTLDFTGCTIVLRGIDKDTWAGFMYFPYVAVEDMEIIGGTFEFEHLPFVQGTIQTIGSNYVDVLIDPAFPQPVPSFAQVSEVIGTIDKTYSVGMSNKAVNYWFALDRDGYADAYAPFVDQGGGVYRITGLTSGEITTFGVYAPVGNYVIVRGMADGPCWFGIIGAGRVRVTGSVFRTSIMRAIFANGCRDVTYDRVKLRPKPGTNIIAASMRDGLDISNNVGPVQVYDCDVYGTGDDALAPTSLSLVTMTKVTSSSFTAFSGAHYYDLQNIALGLPFIIYDKNNVETARGSITDVSAVSHPSWLVTYSVALTSGALDADMTNYICMIVPAQTSLIVHGCRFQNIRGRMIWTNISTSVNDCLFEWATNEGILFEPSGGGGGAAFSYGGGARISVHDCTFRGMVLDGFWTAPVTIYGSTNDSDTLAANTKSIVHVDIQGNIFDDCPHMAVLLGAVSGGTVKNNLMSRINTQTVYGKVDTMGFTTIGAVSYVNCDNLVIGDNTISGLANSGVSVIGITNNGGSNSNILLTGDIITDAGSPKKSVSVDLQLYKPGAVTTLYLKSDSTNNQVLDFTNDANHWQISAGEFGVFFKDVTAGLNRWNIDQNGHLLAIGTGVYDIGNIVNYPARLFGTRLVLKDGVTAPTATTGFAQLYVDTADGDLKVIFGDGTVKTIVVDT